jgi:hypothetical protein
MKYCLLIAGHQYYPAAGTGDWIDTFRTSADAEKVVQKIDAHSGYSDSYQIYGTKYDWYEIVDLRTWINRPDKQRGTLHKE